MDNVYNKLERTRKPRVHIKYEVETEAGVVQKELPFVVGVMGDFSGDAASHSKPLSERKFIQIDKNNFDDVLAKMAPELHFRVENKLSNDNTEIPIHLTFRSMEDFEPQNIAEQVPALKELLTLRNKLRDLVTEVDRSEKLELLLEEIMKNHLEKGKE